MRENAFLKKHKVYLVSRILCIITLISRFRHKQSSFNFVIGIFILFLKYTINYPQKSCSK